MTVEEEEAVRPSSTDTPERLKKPSGSLWKGLLIAALVGALLLAFAIYSGIRSRAKASSTLSQETVADSVPTVAVVHPLLTQGAQEVVLPGNMQAFVDTPIWARSSGYLKAWYVDIGARVKRGQLLAVIESPEVDQQLQQAKGNLTVAKANLKLAEITADRYQGLYKTDSVAKQDVDNAVQDAAAKTATVTADQAAVGRLEQMVSFEHVYAPFDGIITARNVDFGALIDADANSPGKELFHLASNSTLRVYVSVPEVYSRSARPGVGAYLTLTEFPGRQFNGTIVRNTGAIDMSSRTLLVEVDVKNPTGELLPGSYALVHFKLPSKIEAVSIPSNALIFRTAGLQVATVQDGHAQLVPVTLGHDYGDTVEVVSGLKAADLVVVNPMDSLTTGQQVQIASKNAITQ